MLENQAAWPLYKDIRNNSLEILQVLWIVERIHANTFYLVQLQHQQLKAIERASLSSVLQNMGMVLVFYTEQTDSVLLKCIST